LKRKLLEHSLTKSVNAKDAKRLTCLAFPCVFR
jgi:hypothetical protein